MEFVIDFEFMLFNEGEEQFQRTLENLEFVADILHTASKKGKPGVVGKRPEDAYSDQQKALAT